MCLFQKSYAEGFVNSFVAIIFHLVGLELIAILDPWSQSFFFFFQKYNSDSRTVHDFIGQC